MVLIDQFFCHGRCTFVSEVPPYSLGSIRVSGLVNKKCNYNFASFFVRVKLGQYHFVQNTLRAFGKGGAEEGTWN